MNGLVLSGRYEIVKPLGGGGFGQTYLAKDRYLPEQPLCVVKQLKPRSNDPRILEVAKQLFEREAKMLYILGDRCDAIPRLLAHFDEGGEFYLVQEYIQGRTLDSIILPGERLSESKVMELLQKILEPLSVVHQARVIHRDIKPANLIWRNCDSKIVLIDFGAVKALRAVDNNCPDTTALTVAVGSPGYMPSEQLAGYPQLSSDIYAVGTICVQALSGLTCRQIPKQPDTGEFDWQAMGLTIDPEFAKLLARMVRYDWHDRFPDANATLEALRGLLAHKEISAPPASNSSHPVAEGQPTLAVTSLPPTLPHYYSPKSTRLPRNRYRQILLNKVRNFWIEGVLESSLHNKIFLELGLEERKDMVQHPWTLDWVTLQSVRQPMPQGTRLIDLFERMGVGRSLLILGEPGSGKTTVLLELARHLLTRAQENTDFPMPVVFNLSSWPGMRLSIKDWLVQELYMKYQVAREIGHHWVTTQQMLLLLDGLDEVGNDRRNHCVQALNQFMQEYGETELVVCCRTNDYEVLTQRLRLQGAVFIQPLTPPQVRTYLDSLGKDFITLRKAIDADPTLQELTKSPLLLSMMTLSYQGFNFDVFPKLSDLDAYREHLFETYIQRMWRCRRNHRYSLQRSQHWFAWLAFHLDRQRQTVFLIERLQPDWLTDFQRRLYQFLSCALGGVFVGVLGGLNVGRLLGMEVGLTSGLLLMCGVSLSIAIVLGLVHYRIETVESLRWSWSKARNSIPSGIRVGLSVGIMLVLGQLSFGLLHFNFISPTILYQGLGGMGTGLLFVLVKGLSGGGVETTAEPNQGIWKSFHNALLFGTIGTITLGIVGYTFGLSFFGMVVGLLFGLFSPAGLACYQHFILRIVLWGYGYMPWNYAKFMNYGTQLTFLQKVGGGYIFIHRYLLEFFAHKYIERKKQRT